jgi:hypothetical protein
MKQIAIYAEGGGDSRDQKGELRNGLDSLLKDQKQAAQAKRLKWKSVFCGGRQQTYDAFVNELKVADADVLCVLLVDSEDAIVAEIENDAETNATNRVAHLVKRDKWRLADIAPEQIHLMVQCMEAWIVADPEAMAEYYGQGFRTNGLPNRKNLEDEPKLELFEKLKNATRNSKKGAYEKIKHGSKLLQRIDPVKVVGRCSRFSTFTEWLTKRIGGA